MNNHKIEGLLGLCMKAGESVLEPKPVWNKSKKEKVKLVLVAEDARPKDEKRI